MQFANDITPLTLASTAKLRDYLSYPHIYDTLDDKEIEEIWNEIESRPTRHHIPYDENHPHPMRYELSRPWGERTREAVGWKD